MTTRRDWLGVGVDHWSFEWGTCSNEPEPAKLGGQAAEKAAPSAIEVQVGSAVINT
jgi:hypothetical protein